MRLLRLVLYFFVFSTKYLLFVVASDEASSSSVPPEEEPLRCAYFIEEANGFNAAKLRELREPEQICTELGMSVRDERSNMCCGYYARRDILNGTGGFSVPYEIPIARLGRAASDEAARCYAYVDALEDTVCSRFQGNFITENGVLRVCKDSCDMVYNECIGQNNGVDVLQPGFATDGTTLCQNAWDPCANAPNGYFCRQNIAIEVADGGEEPCLAINVPGAGHVQYYMRHSTEVDGCQFVESVSVWAQDNLWWIVLWCVLFLLCCPLCCYCTCYCLLYRRSLH